MGYTDIAVLAGGTRAWEAAGYVLFSGVNVPSKAFGEWVEHQYHTPSVDPGELRAMMEGGQDMVVLDSRPMDEFHRMSIPGAIDVPGGELVYRIGEIAPRPETTIVVNCAGRTRSIMGAESLRSAGVPNKVVALRNGTMGWELAGFSCDRGKSASFPRGTPASLETALGRARAFAETLGGEGHRPCGAAGAAGRCLPHHACAGCARPGGIPAPATCRAAAWRRAGSWSRAATIGSRCAARGWCWSTKRVWRAMARGVRARMTGGWLRQLGGWEVFVLRMACPARWKPAPGCRSARRRRRSRPPPSRRRNSRRR